LTRVIDREPDGGKRGFSGRDSDGLLGVVVTVVRRVVSDGVILASVKILVLAAACSVALFCAGVTSKIQPFFGARTAGP
jgi:hypothetical protein